MRFFAIALFVFTLLGCTDASSKATTIGHGQLKSDAMAMSQRWKATAPEGRSIPGAFWPDSIQQLDPVDVYPHMLGVFVVTEKSDRYHTGIYIVTADDVEEETNPSSASGVGYRKQSRGLHEAEVKIRQKIRPNS